MRILVLLGGTSDEREVSLRSGKAVADALKANKHEVSEYDPADGYSGLKQYVGKMDCVFPILHGKGGEDGEIQSELEKLDFKYLGSGVKASTLCFDKSRTIETLNKSSILTPRGEVVNKLTIGTSIFTKSPYVLKPIDGGSTIDTYIIRDVHTAHYDPEVFKKHPKMLLEELIEGTEITVPVLGQSALPVIEIIPPVGKEFDYENKYNGESQEICPPLHLPEAIQKRAQKIAEKVHDLTGAEHLSRTDIIVTKSGELCVLEINTMPGLTRTSLFPKAAEVSGLPMRKLVDRFLELTIASSM